MNPDHATEAGTIDYAVRLLGKCLTVTVGERLTRLFQRHTGLPVDCVGWYTTMTAPLYVVRLLDSRRPKGAVRAA